MAICIRQIFIQTRGLNCFFAINPDSKKYYFWESDVHNDIRAKLPFDLNPGMNTLKIRQRGKVIDGFVNDKHVRTFLLSKEVSEKQVGIQFKAYPNTGGEIFSQDFRIRMVHPIFAYFFW